MTTTAAARIEADPTLPIIRITRDFRATPQQLFRAHTDPELFVRWVGPDSLRTTVEVWDARTGGSWAYVSTRGEDTYRFHGCFHELRSDRIVQTFTWDGDYDGVALETLTFEALDGGQTRLRTQSLVDNVQARDQWLAGGMQTGVDEGYAKLARLLADGAL